MESRFPREDVLGLRRMGREGQGLSMALARAVRRSLPKDFREERRTRGKGTVRHSRPG